MRQRFFTFKRFFSLLVTLSVLGIAGLMFGYAMLIKPHLPDVKEIKDISLTLPLQIFSADGQLISEYGERRRTLVSYKNIPDKIVTALLVAEDDDFFSHSGVDFSGLVRAFINLLMTGEKSQGASTITMQVARNFFLSREKSYLRKIREIFVARQLEEVYSKEEILTLYINRIFLGHRSYGFAAAARTYYNRKMSQLNWAQVTMLAGLPKAPSAFNPIANGIRAKIRRDYILKRLYDNKHITEKEYQEAIEYPVITQLALSRYQLDAGHAAQMVHQEAQKLLRDLNIDNIYERGIKIFTTLKNANQKQANVAVRRSLLNYIRRHHWSGVEKQVNLVPLSGKDQVDDDYEIELIDYTHHLPKINGLVRGIIYHIEDKSIWLISEFGERFKLSKKDVKWAFTTWKKENSPYQKALVMQNQIRQDILNLIELGTNKDYFLPLLKKSPQKTSERRQALPLGGLVYLHKNPVGSGSRYALTSSPKVQAALVSLDVNNGAILALVGGFNFSNYKFNRVTQAKRQPGSNFKPFLYATALSKGMTAATIVNDAPVSFEDEATGFIWTPHNYSGRYFGPTRLRTALTYSRNLVSVRLLRQLGLKYTIGFMENFGFEKRSFRENRNLSISLGSSPLTPLEVVRGFAVFANGGFLINPYLIERMEDRNGLVLYQSNPVQVCKNNCSALNPAPRTLDADISYIMSDIMEDVIQRGTGVRAKVLKRKDIVGKTGTTNNQFDAWFSGFNESIATTVWVGYDQPKTMGERETGARAALPIWIDYHQVALADTPEQVRQKSSNIVSVRINKKTGKLAKPTDDENDIIIEIFRIQNSPSANENTTLQEQVNPLLNEENVGKQTNEELQEELFQ